MGPVDCMSASLAQGFLTDLNGSTALLPARRRGSPSIATGQAPLAIALAVAAVFALAGSGPALAQTFGGQGGSLDGTPTTAGGTAGVGGGFNQAGGDADPSSFSGGGGGGATLSNAGGARPGGAAPNSGGAGGSGGLNGYDASTGAFSPTTAYTGTGGAAGLDGTGPFDAGGGGGGAGGYGAILTGTGSVTTQSAITGGTGGAGGNATSSSYGTVGGFGGNGGDGGVGIDAIGAATITTTAAADIRGGYGGVGGLGGGFGYGYGGGTAYGNVGNGGAGIVFLSGGQLINAGVVQGGTAGTPDISGNGGAGGIGVVGANIAIVNAGIIAGGQSADGTRVAAVAFAGGTNSLTLQAGYVFDGVVVAFSAADTLALGGATNASFDTGQIGAAGSGSQFQGFGIYQKTGTSTWTLTGTTGETTSWQVLGGALAIANDAALGGPAGTLTLAGGALRTTASFASPRGITLGAAGGTLNTDAGTTFTAAGVIGGPGSLTKIGSGTLILTQTNTYAGGTAIDAGTLVASSDANFGANTGPLSFAGGATLRLGASFDIAATRAVTLVNGGGTIDTNGFTTTIGSTLSGVGGLVKIGLGTLNLTAANSYQGGTSILAGTAGFGTGTSFGSGGIVLSNATLAPLVSGLTLANGIGLDTPGGTVATGANDLTLAGAILGSGALTKTGAGSLTVTQANLYSGGTLLQGGALTVGNSQSLGTGSLAMSDGTVLRFAADGLSLANTVALAGAETVDTAGNGATLAGVVSGAGSLTKVGAGTLALTGTNTYAGGTAINGGTVRASADANLGAASGPLSFAGGATLQFGAAFDLAPTRTVTLNAGGGTIDTNGVDTTIGSVVGGAGSLTKAGAGTLALTGTNSYAGGTAINGGVVVATADANLGAATGPLSFAGGTLRLGAAFDPAATRSITLNAGGGTIDTNGFVTTLGSTVSGVGSLTKAGLGSLALTQANSYAGGTLLQMGTLVVGNSQSLGTGPLSMDDGTTLAFAADGLTIANAVVFTGVTDPTIDTGNNSETISGVISGPGALTKIGVGTLDLTGTNTYTGATTVAQGTLLVDGSVAGSVVSVASGAFVGGSGTLGGLVALAGSTVAPGAGTPYSTLTVAGNVTFDGGSTYEVRIDAAGQTDLVRATGTATISGASTVSVLAANGAYTAGQTYTILTAASRTGSFVSPPTTTSNLAFLSPTLTTDAANDVILSLAQSPVTFPSVAQTPNQSAAAGGIQGLGAGNPLYNAVQGQTTQGALRAFDATSGEAHASAASVAILDSRFVPSTIFDRLWNVGGAGLDAYQILQGFGPTTLPTLLRCYAPTSSSVPAIPSTYAVWGQAIGIFGHNDGDGNAASLDRTLGGFIVGFDAPVYGTMGDVWRFGAAAGYTKDWFGTPARDSDGTYGSVFGTLYGGARFGSVDLRFGASYAANSTTLRRTVAFPGFLETERSTYGGDTVQGFGEFGYRFAIGKSVFEPIAGFTATHVEQDGFREKGGAAALLGFGRDTDVQTTTLGFRSEASPFESLPVVARIMLGWQHAFGDLSPTSVVAFEAGSAPFTVSGAPIDRDALVAEAELNYRVTSSLTLGLSYTGQVGQRADENSVRGRIDYRF